MGSKRLRSKGVILIFALWTLTFLSILALQLGMMVRQKIMVLTRLERRSQLRALADAGARKAIAILKENAKSQGINYNPVNKTVWHNNPAQLGRIEVGAGAAQVSFLGDKISEDEFAKQFGAQDEESKLNINTATTEELKNLFMVILGIDKNAAEDLARAIVNWRELASSELVGFFSQEYYQNLEFPYPVKRGPFEVLDELLLVEGIHKSLYEYLLNYLTIYSNGKVNINTAPAEILSAIGFSPEIVSKIIVLRRGADGKEATFDDYIFEHPYNLTSYLTQIEPLKPEEMENIDTVNFAGKFDTVSHNFSIQSTGQLPSSGEKKVIRCVFNLKDDKIIYWREE